MIIKKYRNDFITYISIIEISFSMDGHKMQICFVFEDSIGPCMYIYDSTKNKYLCDYDYIGILNVLNHILVENNNGKL